MKITFAAVPAFGHVYPMVPLAVAAQAAGHEVTFVAGELFLGRLPVPTSPGITAGYTLHDAEQEAKHAASDRDEPFWFPLTLFGVVMPRHTRPGLLALWKSDGLPDLLVYEVSNLGAAQAAAEAGVPAVAFRLGMQSPDLFTSLMYPRAGVPVTAMLDATPPTWSPSIGVEGVRRIPIRTVPWSDATGPLPDWLLEPGAGPIAYLTLGTVAFGAVDVLRRSVLETAESCARILVAVGPEGNPQALGDLPAGVHVERFVDQPKVLPHVDIAIHHGGSGTVLSCLATGVRQVLTPQGADQFLNAARIAELGLGAAVHNDSEPGAVGAAVEQLLRDAALAERVRAIRDEVAAMPDPAAVVEDLVAAAHA